MEALSQISTKYTKQTPIEPIQQDEVSWKIGTSFLDSLTAEEKELYKRGVAEVDAKGGEV